MPVFRLTFNTIITRKVWVIVALLVGVLPWFGHQFTPGSYNPTLVGPSIINFTWSLAWLTALVWGLHQAAAAGNDLVSTGLGEFFRARGISKTSQFGQITLAIAAIILPIFLIASLVSFFGARPTNPEESKFWFILHLQCTSLAFAVICQLIVLAVAIGSRFGTTSGLLIPLFLAFSGLVILPHLSEKQALEGGSAIGLIWGILPHYHLADLTNMLIFKLGSLPTKVWAATALYLFIYFVLLAAPSLLLFRTHRRPLRIRLPIRSSVITILAIASAYLSFTQASQAHRSREPNPLGLYGSPLGMTVAIAMQGPADTILHGGMAHDDDDDDEHSTGPPSKAEILDRLDSAASIPEFIKALKEGQNTRYNLIPLPPELDDYRHQKLGAMMELAWRLDPTNATNYLGMSFLISTISKGDLQTRHQRLIYYNEITRRYAARETWDPTPMLTAANSAMTTSVFLDLANYAPKLADREHQLVATYHQRALEILNQRVINGELERIPVARQEEIDHALNEIRTHLRFYSDRIARPQAISPHSLPQPQ